MPRCPLVARRQDGCGQTKAELGRNELTSAAIDKKTPAFPYFVWRRSGNVEAVLGSHGGLVHVFTA